MTRCQQIKIRAIQYRNLLLKQDRGGMTDNGPYRIIDGLRTQRLSHSGIDARLQGGPDRRIG